VKPSLLIFELRMMGDAIMSLPFVRAAMEKYEVFVCCQPSVADVFRTMLPEDRLILWRPPWLDEEKKYGLAKWRNSGLKSVLQRLRKVRAQTAVSVWADTRVHILMALCGAQERVGFPMTRQNIYASQLPWRRRQIVIGKLLNFFGSVCLGRKLLTKKISRSDYYQHHVEDWRQLAGASNLNWSVHKPWLKIPSKPLPENISKWIKIAQSSGQKIWLWHLGARLAAHRWPLERVQKVVEGFFVKNKIPLLLLQSPGENVPAELAGLAPVLAAANLPELFQIVNAADFLICNDTGVSHIGAALGKPVISIFGASLPQWFGPYDNSAFVVQHDVCPHRPCLDRCVMPSYICIEAVTVEMVKQQIEKLGLSDAKANACPQK
jgi:ADP-heptose:LPS heptosyltransferase